MRAFLLAAGLGTRLKPLTDALPKALVPVHGLPMLDRLAAALTRGGVTELGLNTHHLAGMVERHLEAAESIGHFASYPDIPAHLFHEPVLLGTGGGLLNASAFWPPGALLVWNADILADLDPAALMAAHENGSGALATLVVSDRTASSRLLFDETGALCGIDSPRRNDFRTVRPPVGKLSARAFHGVSVLGTGLRMSMGRSYGPGSVFDLIDALLHEVETGASVRAYDAGDTFWGSTGTPKELERLERELTARPELLTRWTP